MRRLLRAENNFGLNWPKLHLCAAFGDRKNGKPWPWSPPGVGGLQWIRDNDGEMMGDGIVRWSVVLSSQLSSLLDPKQCPVGWSQVFLRKWWKKTVVFFFSFAAGPIIFHDVVLFLERVRLKKLHSSRAKWIHFYLCYKLNEKIIYFSKTSTGGKLNCWCKLLGDRDRADSVKGTAEKGKEYFIRPTGNTGRFLHQRWTFSLWESTVPWTAKRGQLVYFSTYPLPQFQRMAFLFYLQNINSRS